MPVLLQLFEGFGRNFSHHDSFQFRLELGGHLRGWILVHLLKPNNRSAQIRILFGHMHATNLHRVLDGRPSHRSSAFRFCSPDPRAEKISIDFFRLQSTNISNGVYNSEWYTGASIYQKYLILIIMRSQRPQTLKAYKFSYASQKPFSGVSKALERAYLNIFLLSLVNNFFRC